MAKPLPRIDGVSPERPQAEEPKPAQKPQFEPISMGYKASRIDVKLPGPHADIFHTKWIGLMDRGARLKDGTEVTDRTKAFLWILENEVTV